MYQLILESDSGVIVESFEHRIDLDCAKRDALRLAKKLMGDGHNIVNIDSRSWRCGEYFVSWAELD